MRLTRREALGGTAAVALGGVAGCLGSSSGETVDSLPSPTLGPSDAAITVKAYEDFACSHCGTFSLQHLPDIVSEYVEAGDVRYEHHDFPFVDAEWSWKTASAARAVQDTVGDEAFFEYSKLLYQNMNSYTLDLIESLAGEVDADPETVRSAASDLTYRPVLETDKQSGEDMGVQGTPTVFVDGEKAADYRFSTVSSLIDSKL